MLVHRLHLTEIEYLNVRSSTIGYQIMKWIMHFKTELWSRSRSKSEWSRGLESDSIF